MKQAFAITVALGLMSMSAQPVMAQAEVGQPAPAFTATDVAGKPVSLAQFKGKYVVLEWTNPGCPFVAKHYNSGNMPRTQQQALAKQAVWISIQTVPGPDHSQEELLAWQKSKGAKPTVTIVDTGATIAKSYRATATPHMYIVAPDGKLIYAGAIDSKPSANPDDIQSATNYVTQALEEAMAGKRVSQPVTRAYGCSVKYPGQV